MQNVRRLGIYTESGRPLLVSLACRGGCAVCMQLAPATEA